MNSVCLIICALLILTLNVGAASADELSPFALGTRAVFISPSAKFDSRLSNGGNGFNDDFRPDIFIELYPFKELALEYSFMVSDHDFNYGSPIKEMGSTWLATQSISAKLYFTPDSSFSPYIGGGINIMLPYSTASSINSFSIDNHTGWMAQAGFDVRMSKSTWFNFDYRYMDMDTTAQVNGTSYRFDISPNVFGFGVKYRN